MIDFFKGRMSAFSVVILENPSPAAAVDRGHMGEVGMGASFNTTKIVDILLNFGILIADSPVMGEAGSWEAA
ncbi:hypothetical protein [Rhodovulum sulfidophilum]|uniref:hypothetical protein n=1 Tax=Rhodovulum sulfidophilum TaxID=35806 RepID=UPI0019212AA8|nr:hypothetical protein [Rhodovulum sulfidophilum]MBL3562016.1 hypothetical protein [Rhodovulum sulfidophilum]